MINSAENRLFDDKYFPPARARDVTPVNTSSYLRTQNTTTLIDNTSTGSSSSTSTTRTRAREGGVQLNVVNGRYDDDCISNPIWDDIQKEYELLFGRTMLRIVEDEIKGYVSDGLELDMVLYALQETETAERVSWRYTSAILRRWMREGVTNKDALEGDRQRHEEFLKRQYMRKWQTE